MVAGTSSSAGKSVIVAALCRILSKRGYSVAPFKAQNMSLNSYVTKNGKEIAIAQAYQALAAGIEPDERMNPILLKPKGNFRSQLVVLGEAVKDVSIKEYYGELEWLKKVVEDAYKSLKEEFDVVVVEGAGGFAEINLFEKDLANIFTARIAKPKIIIAADIERGGAFASLYGTYSLLPEDVRKLVVGFIINKMRGDKSLLNSGIAELERLTGTKCFGIIPHAGFNIFSEDSLSLEEWENDGVVGVLRLPRISNFTDFEKIREVVKIVNLKEDLNDLEALIIPGTKETIRDLKEVKKFGMDEKIRRFAKNKPVIGICGGFQILGKEIVDEGVEYGKAKVKGLGLIDAVTFFKEFKKRTVQVEKRVTRDVAILDKIKGEKVRGYEIHMGVTKAKNPVFEDDGGSSEDGLVWGTYLHGLFLNDNVRKALYDYLGIIFKEETDEFEKFVDIFEKSVDIERIIELI
ncbi:cobyric acid synthase CobQ [Ferroglobus placidus DSM 10642]|uniref:Probable cobyric acid synthase n=1 Tax=Ferroglobus placidus (strain DSM 10642 / AEDII12DO) TaxID=589924 RepID=D3RZN0_FERPA|nr:cobyric acid synthase CobQ [Ferroglobus placidus DSM 10642]